MPSVTSEEVAAVAAALALFGQRPRDSGDRVSAWALAGRRAVPYEELRRVARGETTVTGVWRSSRRG